MNAQSLFQKLYKNRLPFLPYFRKEKNKRITTLVLTLLTLSFFGIFAISPTLSTIAQLQKELSDSKDVNTKLQQKIADLVTLHKQYMSLNSSFPLIFEIIPQKANVPLIIAQIQMLAGQSNVVLSNLQSSQVDLTNVPVGADASSFAFSLTAGGDYKDVASFISKLTTFNRIISIDSVSISQTQKGLTQLSLRGKAYFKS